MDIFPFRFMAKGGAMKALLSKKNFQILENLSDRYFRLNQQESHVGFILHAIIKPEI